MRGDFVGGSTQNRGTPACNAGIVAIARVLVLERLKWKVIGELRRVASPSAKYWRVLIIMSGRALGAPG